ncbi:MAG: nucleotidyltransferase domain-containing protein [Candidatus Adiutrix sp.]|jgi:predicted nucleotidyltransferase|nr:nucleotidyltransferase domain-containing protein [Candidatus Adiutrix sp.]
MELSRQRKISLIRQAEALCREHGASLLFLTLFGSSLYGTETPGKSDLDVRGIFLPSREALALNKAPRSLQQATNGTGRINSAEDVDIDLWSAQHWLLKLLPAGDTGALDMLFSPSRADCTLFKAPVLDKVFAEPGRLMDMTNGGGYAAYSLGQAKKYGLKCSRIGALKAVHNWLLAHLGHQPPPEQRLHDVIEALVAACADGRYCALEIAREEKFLRLCGKFHAENIRLTEFIRRVEHDLRRYGARAEEATRNQGLDFKALSHALRALMQLEELLRTGGIVFPLTNREELIAVKLGQYAWDELEPMILARFEAVEALREKAPVKGKFDRNFAEACVLDCYDRKRASLPGPHDKTRAPHFQDGFSIPEATLGLIEEKLSRLEADNRIKILYACESGSRAWGFASEDSDYDVRFIYVHEPDWYLGLAPEEKRDVLEPGLETAPFGELDLSGWELRKALKLFRRSNPVVLEWLSSPLVYCEAGPFASLLREAAPVQTSPVRVWRHYRGLMERSKARYWDKRNSIKAWFYIMRPLLAMRWIEMGKGLPPMRFDLLMDGVIEDGALHGELASLVARKKDGREKDGFAPPALVAAFVEKEMLRLRENPPRLPSAQEEADLDGLFKTALTRAWG